MPSQLCSNYLGQGISRHHKNQHLANFPLMMIITTS